MKAQGQMNTTTRTTDRVDQALLVSMAIGMGIFLALAILGRWFPESPVLGWGWEDGAVEYAGAALWFAVSALCAFRLVRGREPRLLLAVWMVLAFLFFGEEISWFQRIAGFDTPEAVVVANAQGEFNLHNLSVVNMLLDFEWMFRLGFFAYFFVLPLLTASRGLAALALRFGYVAPGRTFLLMVWAVIGWSIVAQVLGGEDARRVISEARETFYAFSVLVYVYLYLRSQPRGEQLNAAMDQV